MNPGRRRFINKLATGSALAAAAPFLIRNALAMGDRHYTQGFHKLEGTVLLNNKPATQGMLVKPEIKLRRVLTVWLFSWWNAMRFCCAATANWKFPVSAPR